MKNLFLFPLCIFISANVFADINPCDSKDKVLIAKCNQVINGKLNSNSTEQIEMIDLEITRISDPLRICLSGEVHSQGKYNLGWRGTGYINEAQKFVGNSVTYAVVEDDQQLIISQTTVRRRYNLKAPDQYQRLNYQKKEKKLIMTDWQPDGVISYEVKCK